MITYHTGEIREVQMKSLETWLLIPHWSLTDLDHKLSWPHHSLQEIEEHKLSKIFVFKFSSCWSSSDQIKKSPCNFQARPIICQSIVQISLHYISSDGSKPHDSLVRNGFSGVIFPSFLLYLEAEAEWGILLIVHSPFNSLEKIIIEIIFSVRTSWIFTRIFILVVPDTYLFSLDINAKNLCSILLDIIKLVLLD